MEGVARRLARTALAAGVVALAVLVSVLNAIFLLDVVRSANPSYPEWYTPADVAGKAAFAALVCLAATIPALILLWLLARRAKVRASSLVLVAGAAAVAVGINGGRIQYFALPQLSPTGGFDWDGVLVTPVVEELLKVAAVAVVMVAVGARSARAGIVLGAAAGIGMTAFETAYWIVSNYVLEVNVWFGIVMALRFALLGLGMHATATAFAGLGVGAWLERGRRRHDAWMPLAGLLGAVGVHATWNAVGEHVLGAFARLVLPASQEPGFGDTFAVSSMAAVVLLAAPWIALAVAWRRNGPQPADHEREAAEPEREAAEPEREAAEPEREAAEPEPTAC
jgi:RsiW-degrading membrane proteinase PrsW (M82 family)